MATRRQFTRIIFVVLSSVLMCGTDTVYAFDGVRQGGVIGIGAGAGRLLKYRSQTLYGFSGPSQSPDQVHIESSANSIHLEVIFGAGITERTLLLFSLSQRWYNGDPELGFFSRDGILISYTFGARKYLQHTAPSLYFEGGMGFGFAANRNGGRVLGLNDTKLSAPTIRGAIGYEFARHYSVDFTTLYTWIDNNEEETWNLGITLKALAY